MKSIWSAVQQRLTTSLRNLLTLGAVLPGDEENEWTPPESARVIPVDFGARREARRGAAG